MALALGGCLRAPPVQYGITEDTGGHITYVLGAMQALADLAEVEDAEIVTRLIDEAHLGPEYARPSERIGEKLRITRVDTGNPKYLSKEALAGDLPAFKKAFLEMLRSRDERPDIIHAHFADAAEVARAAREEFGIPFVYTAHSLVNDKVGPQRTKEQQDRFEAEDRAIAEADAIIASSRDECERQLPGYPSIDCTKVHRVIPGVERKRATTADIDGAQALLAPFLRQADKPLILAIARPVRKKNLVSLVEAFGQRPELRERANLAVIAGLRESIDQGEAEQNDVLHGIVEAIDRHDLHGSVAWPRRHTQSDITGLYALVRETGGVFVNPAHMEPYGLTLVEAATHGAPVVATRNGGPVDIVSELQHGLLADPANPHDIADRITELLSDPVQWQRCSANGSRKSLEMSWSSYARDFVAIARDITAPRTVRPMGFGSHDALILSDIDNTLTGCRDGAAALEDWARRNGNIAFGVATGRSLHEAMRILRKWQYSIPHLLITDVGSRIWWRKGADLSPDREFEAAIAATWNGDEVVKVLRSVPGIAPQREVDQSPFKKSYLLANAFVAKEAGRALRAAGLQAKCIYSHGTMLDVVPYGAGKAGAMRHVARRLGLPLQKVVAIGDSGNDLDMLSECPNAVLVANFNAELDALAKSPSVYVAKQPYAGGALEGVKRHLFQMPQPNPGFAPDAKPAPQRISA
ncbi:HAD-IIB family hydrolase [Altererythrobacter sp. CAU 1778]